jgi:hypothetical protein
MLVASAHELMQGERDFVGMACPTQTRIDICGSIPRAS